MISIKQDKIIPRITSSNKPFWDALKKHKLLTTRCAECGKIDFPPRVVLCPYCLSKDSLWVPLSGSGILYAYSRLRVGPRPYIKDGPYVVGLVDLDEGVRLLTKINAKYEDLKIGMKVKVGFEEAENGMTLFLFEPDKAEFS